MGAVMGELYDTAELEFPSDYNQLEGDAGNCRGKVNAKLCADVSRWSGNISDLTSNGLQVSFDLYGDMTFLRGVIDPELYGCTTGVVGDVTGCKGSIDELVRKGKLWKKPLSWFGRTDE